MNSFDDASKEDAAIDTAQSKLSWPGQDGTPPASSGPLSTTNSRLCGLCRGFFALPPRAFTDDLHQTLFPRDPEHRAELKRYGLARLYEQRYLYKHCLDDLVQNYENSLCHLCVLVATILQDRKLPKDRDLKDLVQAGRYQLRFAISDRRGQFYADITRKDNALTRIWFTYLNTVEGVDVGEISKVTPLQNETSSELTFDLLRTWLKKCLDSHKKCSAVPTDLNNYSSRLVDVRQVETQQKVTVRDTQPMQGRCQYLALSHCWGKSKKLLLTKDSKARLESGISISELAPTFREAAITTFRLGYEYIWIDSLCIIQDDPSDWERESVKMGSIYGNAVCTIAAVASHDSEGGCFRTRIPLQVQPLRFESCPFVLDEESLDHTRPLYICSHSQSYDDWKGPLDDRAWVVQEQVLASRTILFTSKQVIWQCRCMTASEAWYGGMPNDFRLQFDNSCKTMFDLTRLQADEFQDRLSIQHEMRPYSRWRKIVKLYCARQLTRPEDKLPALSGIATRFALLTKDEYLAGLWKASFLEDLAWYAEPDVRAETRTASYIAPTWSWASVKTKINYLPLFDDERLPKANVLSVTTVPLGTSVTGKIRSGYAYIDAPLRKSAWVRNYRQSNRASLCDELLQGRLNDKVEVYPDADHALLRRDIYLLQLFRQLKQTHDAVHGLVLIAGDKDEYRRAGFFYFARSVHRREEGWEYFVRDWTNTVVRIV